MADAGYRLAVEGEKEFKRALAEINAQIKVNKSELKLLTEEYKLNESGLGTLQGKQDALAESMQLQADKVKLLEDRYKDVAGQFGETDARVLKVKESLNLASAELVKNKAEWEKNAEIIAEFDEKAEAVVRAEEELKRTLAETEAGLRVNTSELKLLGAQYSGTENDAEGLRKMNEVLTDSIGKQNEKIAALSKALNAAQGEFGEQSKEVQEYREQLNNAQVELIEMTKQVDINNEKLQETGDMDMKGLIGGLDDVLDKVGVKIPDGIKDMIGNFDLASVAAGGIVGVLTAGVGKIADISKEAMQWADELTTKAQTIGVGTEEMQALEYAAAALGVSVETIDDVIKEINNKAGETDKIVGKYVGNIKALQEASEEERNAVWEATAEWEALGVRIYNENGTLRDAIDIFYDLVDAFGKVSNSTQRQKQMQDLLGESARRLNPIIEAGTHVLRDLEQEAYDTGVVLSRDTVASLDRSAAAWEKWSMKVKSTLRSIPEALSNLFSGKWIENLPKLFEDAKLPGYASGTDFHPGGLAIVGEKGPELVNLPRGSQVIPNTELPMMGGEIHQTVNVYVDHVESLRDIERIADGQRTNLRMGYVRG